MTSPRPDGTRPDETRPGDYGFVQRRSDGSGPGPDLALALALADEADAVTMRHFRAQDLVVETKPDRSEVTIADRSAEELIVARLARERPDDAVLGEEHGLQGTIGSSRCWILDPVDGTANFVRGVPVWATLIALQVDGEGRIGVVSAPAMGMRWWAERGSGAYRYSGPGDRRPVSLGVSGVGSLSDAFVTFADGHWSPPARARLDALLGGVWRQRGFGDFWMHMLVAEGAVDVAVEPIVSLWDLAAVQVIVDESGGRFSDLRGAPRADGGDACSTNGLLHDAVLAALAADRSGP